MKKLLILLLLLVSCANNNQRQECKYVLVKELASGSSRDIDESTLQPPPNCLPYVEDLILELDGSIVVDHKIHLVFDKQTGLITAKFLKVQK